MAYDKGISAHTTPSSSPSNVSHIKITLQQSEQARQPLYANFTSLSPGQGIVIVNFGFIDSQVINALQHKIKSGENPPTQITANMACRVALNSHAIHQLTQQLGQLLNPVADSQTVMNLKNSTQPPQEQPSNNIPPEKPAEAPSSAGGFRFPWSKK